MRFDLLYKFCCLDNHFDVIALTETHLDSTVSDSEIQIDGYSIFSKDRNRNGSGVLIYAKNELFPVQLMKLDISHMESLFIKIQMHNKTSIVGVCYRPPNQNATEIDDFISGLSSQLTNAVSLHAEGTPVFLMGDLNDRCTNWESDHSDSELKLKLRELVDEHNMQQLIDKPTRGSNILDLFITNSPLAVKSLLVDLSFDDLDHCPIHAELEFNYATRSAYTRTVRHFNADNLQTLDLSLSHIPWQSILLNEDNVNDMVDTFYNLLLNEINLHIPESHITYRPRDKPGMTPHVRKLLDIARKLNRIAKIPASPLDKNNHSAARKKAKKLGRKPEANMLKKL